MLCAARDIYRSASKKLADHCHVLLAAVQRQIEGPERAHIEESRQDLERYD